MRDNSTNKTNIPMTRAPRAYELDCYEQLPAIVREVLQIMPLNISAVPLLNDWQQAQLQNPHIERERLAKLFASQLVKNVGAMVMVETTRLAYGPDHPQASEHNYDFTQIRRANRRVY